MYRVKSFAFFIVIVIVFACFCYAVWMYLNAQTNWKWLLGSWFGLMIVTSTAPNSFTRSTWSMAEGVPKIGWALSLGMMTIYSIIAAPFLAINAFYKGCVGDQKTNEGTI